MAHPSPALFLARGGPIFTPGAARNGRRTLRPHAQPAAPLRLHRGDMPGGAGMGEDGSAAPEWCLVLMLAYAPKLSPAGRGHFAVLSHDAANSAAAAGVALIMREGVAGALLHMPAPPPGRLSLQMCLYYFAADPILDIASELSASLGGGRFTVAGLLEAKLGDAVLLHEIGPGLLTTTAPDAAGPKEASSAILELLEWAVRRWFFSRVWAVLHALETGRLAARGHWPLQPESDIPPFAWISVRRIDWQAGGATWDTQSASRITVKAAADKVSAAPSASAAARPRVAKRPSTGGLRPGASAYHEAYLRLGRALFVMFRCPANKDVFPGGSVRASDGAVSAIMRVAGLSGGKGLPQPSTVATHLQRVNPLKLKRLLETRPPYLRTVLQCWLFDPENIRRVTIDVRTGEFRWSAPDVVALALDAIRIGMPGKSNQQVVGCDGQVVKLTAAIIEEELRRLIPTRIVAMQPLGGDEADAFGVGTPYLPVVPEQPLGKAPWPYWVPAT